jgi:hypothetical protein
VVTQSDLAELDQLRREKRRIARRERKLRDRIFDRYARGAMVEPGPYLLRARHYQRTSLTWDGLAQVEGDHICDYVRSVLPAKTVHTLSIADIQSRRRGG